MALLTVDVDLQPRRQSGSWQTSTVFSLHILARKAGHADHTFSERIHVPYYFTKIRVILGFIIFVSCKRSFCLVLTAALPGYCIFIPALPN